MLDLPTGTVTLLFTDVEGYTSHCAENEAATLASLRHHDTIMREVINARGGVVFKTVGDAFHAAFTAPQEALRAAIEIQQCLFNSPWNALGPVLQVRMALHIGTPEVRDGDYFGLAAIRVARVRDLGHGGQLLLTSAMLEVVRETPLPGITYRSLDAWHLKGMTRPEVVYQVVVEGLPTDFPPLRSVSDNGSNLPTLLSSFIGREMLLQQISQLLERHTLLTLRGTGGCGKTRLAIEVARQHLPDFPGGVWFVRLDALENPDLIGPEIARTLRLHVSSEQPLIEAIANRFREQPALLILDNCEHLRAVCARLANDLLAVCPELRILATSREALTVPGEQVREVPPLPLPRGKGVPSLKTLRASEAVQLFIARADASAGFVLNQQNASAIVDICRALDGIPLALELAARWVGTLPVEEIARELRELINEPSDDSSGIVPVRQHTMRAAVDWSYRRLTSAEQKLFLALSVFMGGFTLDAARAVGDDSGSSLKTLRLLKGLIDRSLVFFDEQAKPDPRYRLLEPVREVALELGANTPEMEETRTRHRDWYLTYARHAATQLLGSEQGSWLDRLEADNENFRSALKWSTEPEVRLAMAVALHRFWQIRGHMAEGSAWLQRALMQVSEPTLRVEGLNAAGVLAYVQSDYAKAGEFFQEALALYREQQNVIGVAKSLNNVGLIEKELGNFLQARILYEECLSLYRNLNDSTRIAAVLSNLGIIAYELEEYERACSIYRESIGLHSASGNLRDQGAALHNLGVALHKTGDYVVARHVHQESLRVRHILKYDQGVIDSVFRIALTFAGSGETQQAVTAFACAEQMLQNAVDATLSWDVRQLCDAAICKLKASSDVYEFQKWWEQGEGFSAEEWMI